jgi:hypothetical protein
MGGVAGSAARPAEEQATTAVSGRADHLNDGFDVVVRDGAQQVDGLI